VPFTFQRELSYEIFTTSWKALFTHVRLAYLSGRRRRARNPLLRLSARPCALTVPSPLIPSACRADSQTPADALLFERGTNFCCGQIVTALRLKEGRPLGGPVHSYERSGIEILLLESMRRCLLEDDPGESEANRQTRRLRDYMGTLSTVQFRETLEYS
jgi:hypothetical protein